MKIGSGILSSNHILQEPKPPLYLVVDGKGNLLQGTLQLRIFKLSFQGFHPFKQARVFLVITQLVSK